MDEPTTTQMSTKIIAGKPWNIGQLRLPDELSVKNYAKIYAKLHKLGYNPTTKIASV